VKTSGLTPRELREKLMQIVAEVQDPWLRALLDDFMGDEEFVARYSTCYGARGIHHAFVGGLLEHTLNVVQIALAAHALHPELNRDLLITGGLLHDIGKTDELDASLSPEYTDAGKFIGHTVITDRMVRDRIARIEGFPAHLAQLLSHMILSHHGERDYGAPVVPSTLEACALHHADVLDARIQGFKDVINNARAQNPAAEWSEYVNTYQRRIYLGPAEPAEPPVAAPEPDDQDPGPGQLPL
jgi:3'-5' exoribonuclease